jgi:hypothetical protein
MRRLLQEWSKAGNDCRLPKIKKIHLILREISHKSLNSEKYTAKLHENERKEEEEALMRQCTGKRADILILDQH